MVEGRAIFLLLLSRWSVGDCMGGLNWVEVGLHTLFLRVCKTLQIGRGLGLTGAWVWVGHGVGGMGMLGLSVAFGYDGWMDGWMEGWRSI